MLEGMGSNQCAVLRRLNHIMYPQNEPDVVLILGIFVEELSLAGLKLNNAEKNNCRNLAKLKFHGHEGCCGGNFASYGSTHVFRPKKVPAGLKNKIRH